MLVKASPQVSQAHRSPVLRGSLRFLAKLRDLARCQLQRVEESLGTRRLFKNIEQDL